MYCFHAQPEDRILKPFPREGSFIPFLVQRIAGTGTPDAVQGMIMGDDLVINRSVASSAMDGGTKINKDKYWY